MPDFVPFGSEAYLVLLALLVFSRGMDFLSTWIATPNLVLEGNPLAKKLGWKWNIILNAILCAGFAVSPLPAVVICTTSLLVASRNFQQAWLMRSWGEENFRAWHWERLQETGRPLYLLCLFGQTSLTVLVGVAVIYFSPDAGVVSGIGFGVVAYAAAVAVYTLFAMWRNRHAWRTS